jgi:hypothetical protein
MIGTTDLKQPLYSEEDKVANWLYSFIEQDESQNEWSSRDYSRAASKCALAAIATLRNIAFMPVSLQLQLSGAEWGFAIGNVIGVTSLDFWAGSRFIDNCLPKGVGLDKLFAKKETPYLQRVANVGNLAISLLSQIPSVYPAIQYNKGSISIPAGIVVMLGGAVLPLRSIQLSIEKYFNLTSAKKQGIDTQKQELFVNLIRENKQRFINMTDNEKDQFITTLNDIRKLDDSPEKIQAYWAHLLSSTNFTPPPSLDCISLGSTQLSKALGLALTGVYQYVIGEYTYSKTKENVWNNDLFAGILSSLVVGSTLCLTGSAMINSAENLFQSITGINKDVRSQQETLAKKLRSKTMTALQGLGVAVNFLSLGATYIIWNEFYKNETEKKAFEITMCSAIFLLLYAAIPSVINDAEEQMIASCTGTLEEKNAIKISSEYQALADSINNISPENFESFLPHLPPKLLSAIRRDLHETSEAPDCNLDTLPPSEQLINNPLHLNLDDESGLSKPTENDINFFNERDRFESIDLV